MSCVQFLSDLSGGEAHLQPVKIPLNINAGSDPCKQEVKEEIDGESFVFIYSLGTELLL